MELKVEKENLLKGLGWVQGLAEKKSTKPILSCTLISAKGSEVTFSATDLDVAVSGCIEADVSKEGRVAVSARKMFEVIREMPPGEVSIKIGQNLRLEITHKKGSVGLNGIDPEEYPTLPDTEGMDFIKVDASLFREMMDKTIYATAQEETRQNINGVYFHKNKDNKLCMVATDGHRLSTIAREVKGELEKIIKEKGVIFPKKGLQEVKKVLESGVEELEVGLKSNHAVFKTPSVVIFMRLMEGDYPDYMKVLPKISGDMINIKKDDLLDTLKRVSIISEDKSKGIKMSLIKEKMVIESNSPGVGEAREELEIDYKGSQKEMGFNARYMIEAISVINSENILLNFGEGEALSPGVIKPDDDEDHLSIVMPMRVE